MTEDYKVIDEIKNDVDVENNTLFLYNKYLPLIRNTGHRFCFVYAHSNINYDDFIQDAYFTVVKIAEWINLEKVKNPDKFCFSVPLSWALKSQIRGSFKKYVKPSFNGTRVLVDGRMKFYNHDMTMKTKGDSESESRDIIEDSVAVNRVDPIYSQVAYAVLDEYINHHDEVMKHPITLQDEFTCERYTEKPLKKWQLQYLRKLSEGMTIQQIETAYRNKPKDSDEWVAAKQEWFRTRPNFERFIKERINRAIDLNVVTGV